jgi:hypothetical protein
MRARSSVGCGRLGKTRERADRINKLMWDEHAGLYFDYQCVHGRRRAYPFLTTFYPLWAGIASKQQAAAVVRNLPMFERPVVSKPAPTRAATSGTLPLPGRLSKMIAVQGLRRYGYRTEADRITHANSCLLSWSNTYRAGSLSRNTMPRGALRGSVGASTSATAQMRRASAGPMPHLLRYWTNCRQSDKSSY